MILPKLLVAFTCVTTLSFGASAYAQTEELVKTESLDKHYEQTNLEILAQQDFSKMDSRMMRELLIPQMDILQTTVLAGITLRNTDVNLDASDFEIVAREGSSLEIQTSTTIFLA